MCIREKKKPALAPRRSNTGNTHCEEDCCTRSSVYGRSSKQEIKHEFWTHVFFFSISVETRILNFETNFFPTVFIYLCLYNFILSWFTQTIVLLYILLHHHHHRRYVNKTKISRFLLSPSPACTSMSWCNKEKKC